VVINNFHLESITAVPFEANSPAEAAEAAVAGAKPLSMNAYKIEETKVLVRRAIVGEE